MSVILETEGSEGDWNNGCVVVVPRELQCSGGWRGRREGSRTRLPDVR